jgi:hypothetical protein
MCTSLLARARPANEKFTPQDVYVWTLHDNFWWLRRGSIGPRQWWYHQATGCGFWLWAVLQCGVQYYSNASIFLKEPCWSIFRLSQGWRNVTTEGWRNYDTSTSTSGPAGLQRYRLLRAVLFSGVTSQAVDQLWPVTSVRNISYRVFVVPYTICI